MKPVYIVLSTAGVGGAEKRFTDNWYQLMKDFGLNVHLVMDVQTHTGLMCQAGYADKLLPNEKLHVLDLGGGHFRTYCKAVHRFFATQPEGGIVHYPLAYVPGVQWRFRHRLLISWVNSAMPPFNARQWKLGLGVWAGLFAADHVDVLNPENIRRISSVPGMRRKLTLTTGGTQVDSHMYLPGDKLGDLVFLGRAEPEKQCLRFVECLPHLHDLLMRAGHKNYRFRVCGEGREAPAIKAILHSDAFRDVPVEFGYSPFPEQVLGKASVYFSLQKTSNYPSKALAEAIACGAFPVLTEVGESDLMVQGCPYYAFVPRAFTAADLFQAVSSFLNLPQDVQRNVVQKNSHYARTRFAPGQQAAYFADIYRRLGELV